MTASQKFISEFLTRNQKRIREIIEYKAFKFYINPDDLHSQFNYSISRIYHKNTFNGVDEQLWGYIHLAVHNCAISLKREGKTKHNPYVNLDIDEVKENYSLKVTTQPDINLKIITNKICDHLPKTFKKLHWQIVWNEYFMNGHSYEHVAEKANIPIGTVKNIIFKIRERANKYWLNEYKEAV